MIMKTKGSAHDRWKKLWKITNRSVSVLVLAYAFFLFFPSVLFAHSTQHGNFTVYSQQKIEGIETILDAVDDALRTSELYDPSIKQKVFFGNGNAIFEFIENIRWGMASAVYGLPKPLTYNTSMPPFVNHIVTFRDPDIVNDNLTHRDRGPIGMTKTLAHEATHTLMMMQFGRLRTSRSPLWKQEGYPDYVAASSGLLADPTYDIKNSVERILEQDLSWLANTDGTHQTMRHGCARRAVMVDDSDNYWPTCYFIARVLMEYVLDIKGHDIDFVMNNVQSDADLLGELLSAYEQGGL